MGNKVQTSRRRLVGITLLLGLSLIVAVRSFHPQRLGRSPRPVPVLIQELKRQDSWFYHTRLYLWSNTAVFLRVDLHQLKPTPASDIRRGACLELQRLGANAAPAVPYLIRAIDDPSGDVRLEAIRALRAIGPAAAAARERLLRLVSAPAIGEEARWRKVDIFDLPGFARKLSNKEDPVSAFLYDQLSGQTRDALAEYQIPNTESERLRKQVDILSSLLNDELSAEARRALTNHNTDANLILLRKNLVQEMSQIIGGPSVYEPERFAGVAMRPTTRYLLSRPLSRFKQTHLNRILIEDAYPRELLKYRPTMAPISVAALDHAEAAQALAAIAPQDPEFLAILIEDSDVELDRSTFGNWASEFIRRSPYAQHLLEKAANPTGAKTTGRE